MATYKMKNGASKKAPSKQKSQDEYILEMASVVAMHYNGYTIKELVEDVPYRELEFMYHSIQKWRAETLLLLNSIVNGPNSKSKSKKEYKSTIDSLVKMLD